MTLTEYGFKGNGIVFRTGYPLGKNESSYDIRRHCIWIDIWIEYIYHKWYTFYLNFQVSSPNRAYRAAALRAVSTSPSITSSPSSQSSISSCGPQQDDLVALQRTRIERERKSNQRVKRIQFSIWLKKRREISLISQKKKPIRFVTCFWCDNFTSAWVR